MPKLGMVGMCAVVAQAYRGCSGPNVPARPKNVETIRQVIGQHASAAVDHIITAVCTSRQHNKNTTAAELYPSHKNPRNSPLPPGRLTYAWEILGRVWTITVRPEHTEKSSA